MGHITTIAVEAAASSSMPTGADPAAHAAAFDVLATYLDMLGAESGTLLYHETGTQDVVIAVHGSPATPSLEAWLATAIFCSPGNCQRHRIGEATWLVVNAPLGADGATLVFLIKISSNFGCDDQRAENLARILATSLSLQWSSLKRVASYEAALERSEVGLILLQKTGLLLFANRAAGELLRGHEYLRHRKGGIAATSFGDALKLQVAIDHVCNAEGGQNEDPVVVINRRHPLRPLLIHVSAPESSGGMDGDVGAILRIIDPERDMCASIEPVCSLYRLSPVETRLASALASGSTVEDAALQLRIKLQTARSYLKQIFLKTDTKRQSELVRVLLTSTIRIRARGRFRVV